MLENVSIIIPIAPKEKQHKKLLDDLKKTKAEIIISSEGTRTKSLNVGASKAKNNFLWFLHADSRINSENLNSLRKSIEKKPEALHYFSLTGLPFLNRWGANIRSHLFGLPYGDQGFCLSKYLFQKLEGYPENTPYGEDLIFIRRAKKAGIKLNHIPSKLYTSARKYHEYGWLKLTFVRQWQLIKLLRQKL